MKYSYRHIHKKHKDLNELISDSNSNIKSRNGLSNFYSFKPEIDKISKMIVLNKLHTHRSYKNAYQSIGDHLYNMSYKMLEKRNKKYVENRIKDRIIEQRQCTFKPRINEKGK